MRTRKMVADVIENQVAKLLLENSKYTAKELKHKVEKAINGKYKFTDKTYLNVKHRLQKRMSDKPEDELWSIGACLKYDIPSDIIPILIKQYNKEPFTVRVARWVAIIQSIASTRECIKRIYSGYLMDAFVFEVAKQYAEKERISEILEKPFPNTLDLDKIYFTGNEPFLIDGLISAFSSNEQKQAERDLKNFKPWTRELLKSMLGELTQEQANLFNEWWRLTTIEIKIKPSRASQAEKQLLANHSELQPLVDAYWKWCSADDTLGPLIKDLETKGAELREKVKVYIPEFLHLL